MFAPLHATDRFPGEVQDGTDGDLPSSVLHFSGVMSRAGDDRFHAQRLRKGRNRDRFVVTIVFPLCGVGLG